MAKKKVITSKYQIFIQVVNTLLVVAILGFYAYRLFYYKDYFENVGDIDNETEETVTLSDALISKRLADLEQMLEDEENGGYYYINQPVYNYIKYSGRLYRVLDIDAEGNVRAVDTDVIGIQPMLDGSEFDQSAVYSWLNIVEGDDNSGYYERSLVDHDQVLTSGSYCGDSVDDLSKIACKLKKDSGKITMLTLNDYSVTGGANGFVYNGRQHWLASTDSDGAYWFTDEEGNVSIDAISAQLIGVRPVITFKAGTLSAAGVGTKANPFIVAPFAQNKASDLLLGQYVQYSDLLWRVTGVDGDGNVELILNDILLDEEGEKVLLNFGAGNVFTVRSGIGGYLNDTFLDNLADVETSLVKHNWYYGVLNEETFDYHDDLTATYESFVGIPTLATPYLDGSEECFISGQVADSSNLVYIIDENNYMFGSYLDTYHYVRPMICLNGQLSLVKGAGSHDMPFELGGISNGEE